MTAVPLAQRIERGRLGLLADWVAVAVAVALPWSTSATGILIALWLVGVLPTLDAAAVRRELATAAGGLPVALWAFAFVGMLWAAVSWSERFDGLDGFNRLLVIPLLLAHFRRSPNGIWVLFGFFASSLALLLLSFALVLTPGLSWRGKMPGVPVKDYILQSEIFLICAFALLDRAFRHWRGKSMWSVAALVALAALFLANIAFVAAGRTVFLVAPVLALMLGWRHFGLRGLVTAGLLGLTVTVTVYFGSPYLHQRLDTSVTELQRFRTSDAVTSTALHLEFLAKSLSIIATAPVFGHGTGSIGEQFRHAAAQQTGLAAVVSVNPHDQILAVAIQLGIMGALVLLAMWAAHVMLFRGDGLAAFAGMIVVVENVIACLFNSHLFDFSQGWLYVFAVGVAGGMVLREHKSGRTPLADEP
jgi:O-antigen ligase